MESAGPLGIDCVAFSVINSAERPCNVAFPQSLEAEVG